MSSEIGFLGAGHMGRAILNGAFASGFLRPDTVLVVERLGPLREAIAELGCEVAADATALHGVDTLVMCVRPQDFPVAAAALVSSSPRLVVSVMAGLDSNSIADACGEATRVVRAMPNAPASIGRGMTAIAAGRGATAADTDLARGLFEGVGRVVEVAEADMFAVTAVSGSGPAWIYLLAEAMREEGVAIGLDDSIIDELIRGTFEGAAAMLASSKLHPAELKQAVTTPGGTTEAGLAAMDQAGLVKAARAGVHAAYMRGKSIAQEQGQ